MFPLKYGGNGNVRFQWLETRGDTRIWPPNFYGKMPPPLVLTFLPAACALRSGGRRGRSRLDGHLLTVFSIKKRGRQNNGYTGRTVEVRPAMNKKMMTVTSEKGLGESLPSPNNKFIF